MNYCPMMAFKQWCARKRLAFPVPAGNFTRTFMAFEKDGHCDMRDKMIWSGSGKLLAMRASFRSVLDTDSGGGDVRRLPPSSFVPGLPSRVCTK